MKTDIETLATLAQKPTKVVLGLMSGTSLDGLDLALCKISGNGVQTQLELLQFHTHNYSEQQRHTLSQFSSVEQVNLASLCQLNAWLGQLYSDIVLQTLKLWQIKPEAIDLIASHGQTIYHHPRAEFVSDTKMNSTLQLGDGDLIASNTGIITLSDFRQKHIAKGLEGAPLVHYGDFLLYQSKDIDRVLLNLGGIANCTFLHKGGELADSLSSDLGPGNSLIDKYCLQYFDVAYDEGGKLAAQGTISLTLLQQLQAQPFFTQPLPKSTGPELFNLDFIAQNLTKVATPISHLDVLATLTELTARETAKAITQQCDSATELYITGGGLHNQYLMQRLEVNLPSNIEICEFNRIAFDPDAKEAALFALLANETLSGDEQGLPFSMGKLSLPR